MEEILNKNIFNERDLYKLAPDYCPSNIFLRMQMRRTMVNETHNHGFFKNINNLRKPMKKIEESNKINKEIIKIRNSFNHLNLKNEIMLKNVKNIERKIKQAKDLLMEEDSLLDNIPVTYTCEFCEDDLIIENDVDFKLNNKQVVNRPSRVRKKLPSIKPGEIEIVKDETICIKYVEVSKTPSLLNMPAIDSDGHGIIPELKKLETTNQDFQLHPLQNGYENDVSELQKVLVMMALSSKPEENDCDTNVQTQIEIERNVEEYNLSTLEIADITDILNIKALRAELGDREKKLLIKYVDKWKTHVKIQKNNREKVELTKIHDFFDKIEKKKLFNEQGGNKKAKASVRDYSTYQHRYKVQKHIIALQKAKLDDQNRIIEELKYNKIIVASKQSVDAMKEEVRKTYFEIDRQLKPKIKCLTNELKLHEIEEPSLVLHCLKVPQFLQRMEKRAREREEKHAMIRERRRQMEEDRIRMKEQAELAKAEMDKEEKIKRIKELREKRKREKIENIRKKQHVERMRALIVIAEMHYEKSLMIKFGIRPFRKLIETKNDNMVKAQEHYRFQLKKNIFLHWMWYTEDMWFERNYKAEDFYRKKLLKTTFDALIQNHHAYVLKKQVAEDYYDLYVTQLVFRKLRDAFELLKKEQEIKWHKVVVYHNCNILFKTFTCWRTLPAINALRREQEARKAKWRQKVLQVVPDYAPPED